ncbi:MULTISPECIES: riboflavin synthase subunit alpha [unclassified Marinobacterium]|uniref:riboflavin synthase subunit alpha n=1 Tax=unclassified Marinobacterium TaxID=2644139 RepID=UPI001569D73D|nr:MULTISPECIES: riboflavin synthase subunit alpha [unclassified Marinobacterium]NRP09537.1 Riboflavin synthase [Marinobacterium sp. xm-g-48]NRP28454.1 Riboflavin synthase [Marinobacterium sp. xm-d-420]NRP35378.1 Riboflavin synthase [Marinobacterium sp. xm-d-579]NRP52697.1 Riboflavin synthase [Marinobacterium sp. xm-v-242]NRP77278.1 Riboflavin synthase [Marinobacterium sp. xm-m-383]
MFTGIVQGVATVTALTPADNFMTLQLEFPENCCDNFQIGASVGLNGTCLTITSFEGNRAKFDAIQSTLELTNLGDLQVGSLVNFERAAKIGDEIGGHLMSGHICDRVAITAIEKTETNCRVEFDRPSQWAPYLLDKGFVGLNGCSLTMTQVTDDRFSVWLIPETLERTLFGKAKVGDLINLEIDPQTQAIVDTVERYLQERGKN